MAKEPARTKADQTRWLREKAWEDGQARNTQPAPATPAPAEKKKAAAKKPAAAKSKAKKKKSRRG